MNLYDYVARIREEQRLAEKGFDVNNDYLEIDAYNLSQVRIDVLRSAYSFLSSFNYKNALERFKTEPNSEIYLQGVTTVPLKGRVSCLIGVKNYGDRAISEDEFNQEYIARIGYGSQDYASMHFNDENNNEYKIIYFNNGKIYIDSKTAKYINKLTNDMFGIAIAKECLKWEREKEIKLLAMEQERQKKEDEKLQLYFKKESR